MTLTQLRGLDIRPSDENTLESRVGNTPLLRIRSLSAGLPADVRLFAKAEWFNPGGSIKDRPALNIIRHKAAYGEVKPMGSRAYESSMLNVFRRLDADNFQTVLIERKEDVWPSFKALLAKDRVAESASA